MNKNTSQRTKQKQSNDHIKIRWVLFDLDGTLADSLSAMNKAYHDFLGHFGHKGTQKEFDELNGPSLKEIVGILHKRYRLPIQQRELMKIYMNNLVQIYEKDIKPFPDTQKVLGDLINDDYRLALVTSSMEMIAKPFIKKQGLNRFFKRYVFGGEVRQAKPHPMIYRHAVKKIKALPGSVVVVEDSPNGIRSARTAGLFVIGISHGRSMRQLKENGAQVVVRDLKEVPKIIRART